MSRPVRVVAGLQSRLRQRPSLVSRGADVMVVNRAGQTTVDMANNPEQRTQPFPATIALLEKMARRTTTTAEVRPADEVGRRRARQRK